MVEQNQDTRKEYLEAWKNTMVNIWRDRMDRLGVFDTGALRGSLVDGTLHMNDMEAQMAFKFLQYGIYVDLGVGNGYYHGNGGDLYFLDTTYRHEHKLGEPRKRKPWFSKSWYISVQVLKEKMAHLIGEDFAGMFDNLNDRERG